jgi:hypothetical protein
MFFWNSVEDAEIRDRINQTFQSIILLAIAFIPNFDVEEIVRNLRTIWDMEAKFYVDDEENFVS